jgi:hypothetical protein
VHAFLFRWVDLGRSAQQAHTDVRVLLAQERKELEPVTVADVQVQKDYVDSVGSQEILSDVDRRRLEHAVVLQLEVDPAQHPQSRIILNHKHRCRTSPHRPLLIVALLYSNKCFDN